MVVPVGGRAGTRKIATGQVMQARGPAAKHGTPGIGGGGTNLAWRWRRPAYEDETYGAIPRGKPHDVVSSL